MLLLKKEELKTYRDSIKITIKLKAIKKLEIIAIIQTNVEVQHIVFVI